ncbi:MAG: transposase [Candidatus Sumerlaeota bacterium]
MAIIEQNLFSWQVVESSTEIQRFQAILATTPDEALMRTLEAERRGRRNDWPIRAMWNALIAMVVFRHDSIASLRRELERNGELRQACGFALQRREVLVNGEKRLRPLAPSKDAFRRFIKKLAAHLDLVTEIFQALTEGLADELPDFGRYLATDGKAIRAARSDDPDADWGAKRQGNPDGDEQAEITRTWLGYKVHMVCDATYELPVTFRLTEGSRGESPLLKEMVEDIDAHQPKVLDRTKVMCGDRGFDDGEDKRWLAEVYGIAPIIPARDMTQGRYEPLDDEHHDTIYVSPTGCVACRVRPFDEDVEKQFAPMTFMGYEHDRQTLKFRCPAAAWGIECENQDACAASAAVKAGTYGRVVRVKLDTNRRLFGPVYSHSNKFADLYAMRTSVERLFARLDHMYGFERHHTVGLKAMKVRTTLAMIAMQATALNWIKAGKDERMRTQRPAA